MRICFCDDEASTRSQFERMAAAWAEQRGEAAELQLYNSAEQLLFEVGQPEAQELAFDLILLDMGWTASRWQGSCGRRISG